MGCLLYTERWVFGYFGGIYFELLQGGKRFGGTDESDIARNKVETFV